MLRLIEAMLKAGSYGKGRLFPTERGTPQGGVVSPLLSNILLTPFESGDEAQGISAYEVCRRLDQVRALTRRRVPLKTKELIAELNPVLRGWGHHYKRAHDRKLFHRLDGWIVRRIRSQRFKRWRNGGWRQLPETKLYGEYGLVNLIQLIPSIASRKRESS